MKSILALAISLLASSCGLFHRGVPKAGEFCDVLQKPPVCIRVDFENRLLVFQEKYYPLQLKTRTIYLFDDSGKPGEVWAMTENRVEIRFPQSSEPAHFYLRKKEKKSK